MNYNHEKIIPRVGLFLLFNTQFIKIIGILQIRADLNINQKCSGLINFLPLSNNSSPLTLPFHERRARVIIQSNSQKKPPSASVHFRLRKSREKIQQTMSNIKRHFNFAQDDKDMKLIY